MGKPDFNGTVPKGFVLAKPIEHTVYDPKIIYKLEKDHRLMITRKRNGWKMYLEVNAWGEIRFLTDGLNKIANNKVGHLIKEAKKLNLPPKTLLVGEVVFDTENDDRGKVISIMQAKDEKKIADCNIKLHYILFNIVFWYGKSAGDKQDFLFNYNELSTVLKEANKLPKYIHLVELLPSYLEQSFDRAKERSMKEGWEGLVLYDSQYKLTYREDGKSPKRPEGCYKWKPTCDGDFIVREVIYRPGTAIVKELILLQIDPTTGKEFNCGKYGTFTKVLREWLSREASYPLVVELKFDSRYRKTGKLENPRDFVVRNDKKPEHCLSPESFPEAEVK